MVESGFDVLAVIPNFGDVLEENFDIRLQFCVIDQCEEFPLVKM